MTRSNNCMSSKIDKIFFSKNLDISFKYLKNFESCMSDHKIVMANFIFKTNINNSKTPKIFKSWKLNDKILEKKSVKEGIKEICKKIPSLKEKFKYIWYDKFNKQIVSFLKKINKEYEKTKNKEKRELFEELKRFNITTFQNNEDYLNRKNELTINLDNH